MMSEQQSWRAESSGEWSPSAPHTRGAPREVILVLSSNRRYLCHDGRLNRSVHLRLAVYFENDMRKVADGAVVLSAPNRPPYLTRSPITRLLGIWYYCSVACCRCSAA